MEVYIPDFGAGPDILTLIRDFVGEEQELWFYYRCGCENILDIYEYPWEDADEDLIRREMLDAWIVENAPVFVRELFFSIEDTNLSRVLPGNMADFPELLEEFYREKYDSLPKS